MDTTDVQQHLAAAVEAAKRNDLRTFVIEVAMSHAPDGMVRGLAAGWPRVERGVIEAVVAEAAEALYQAVSAAGRLVKSPGAYLWGAAQNLLRKRYRDADGDIETVPFIEGTHDPGQTREVEYLLLLAENTIELDVERAFRSEPEPGGARR